MNTHLKDLSNSDEGTLSSLITHVTRTLANGSASTADSDSSFSCDAIAGVSCLYVEAARLGFEAVEVKTFLERECEFSTSRAKIVAEGYGTARKGLERDLKRYASSSAVCKLKSHACRADYVVSTSTNGDKREHGFHHTWLVGGRDGDETRLNFTCDKEEMLHLLETLREACKATEAIAAHSASA